ncbi:MAG: Hpt domain-containing protein [Defluviitaleaceae bacterium]|nr:Hpt domain-containing protein [Defluviitaleaceae bacterium]
MRKPDREEVKRRRDFVKGQKYTIHDLRAEIAANHYATAHRLVHTLKGLAGLIGEEPLRNIALNVEQQLRNKKLPPESEMESLERELNRVLNEITDSGIMDDEVLNHPPTLEEQSVLFDKLQALLTENDTSCIELTEEISLIPETKVLVRQIENFAFKPALVTLTVLREVLGV